MTQMTRRRTLGEEWRNENKRESNRTITENIPVLNKESIFEYFDVIFTSLRDQIHHKALKLSWTTQSRNFIMCYN